MSPYHAMSWGGFLCCLYVTNDAVLAPLGSGSSVVHLLV